MAASLMTTITWRRFGAIMLLVAAAMAAVTLPGCEEAEDGRFRVKICDEVYDLEVAATEEKRVKGLGDRKEIEEDGGMIFAFTKSDKNVKEFVMRDCLTDIDILFVDDSGRIVKWHEMKMEEPRREGETERQYEMRLKRYSSVFPVRIAIELAPGSIKELREQGMREGRKVECELDRLKALAQ